VTPDAVQQALATASIAVLPSREEAFPMFLVEAMAQGCAIVATDVGGVRELLGEAGLLVRADDADALGDALTRLISEPGTRAEFAGASAARAAERFDAGRVARQWADTYAALAGQPSTSGGGASGG
jgi:glycosyltransferase involved in cell wall biosynthesis